MRARIACSELRKQRSPAREEARSITAFSIRRLGYRAMRSAAARMGHCRLPSLAARVLRSREIKGAKQGETSHDGGDEPGEAIASTQRSTRPAAHPRHRVSSRLLPHRGRGVAQARHKLDSLSCQHASEVAPRLSAQEAAWCCTQAGLVRSRSFCTASRYILALHQALKTWSLDETKSSSYVRAARTTELRYSQSLSRRLKQTERAGASYMYIFCACTKCARSLGRVR